MQVKRLSRADRDLDEIWEYLADFDTGAARRQIARIVSAYSRLSKYPYSAPAAPDWGESVRSLTCDRYKILHKVGPDSVDILRIVHQAREPTNILDPD